MVGETAAEQLASKITSWHGDNAKKSDDAKTTVKFVRVGAQPVEVTQQQAAEIFPSSRAVAGDNHAVKCHDKVFYKYLELGVDASAGLYPGQQYHVDLLYKILFQSLIKDKIICDTSETTSFCMLGVEMTDDEEPSKKIYKNYMGQASAAIDGVDFHLVLEHPLYQQFLERISPENFAAVFIHNLLVNPSDGKPQNFMAVFYKLVDGQKVQFKPSEAQLRNYTAADLHNIQIELIGFDNDHTDAPEIYANPDGEHNTEVKSVLFFLQTLLAKPLPEKIREYFKTLNITMIIGEWLLHLYDRNNHYLQMMRDAKISQSTMKQVMLPIRLRSGGYGNPGTIERVHNALSTIKDLCNTSDTVTLEKIFQQTSPLLHKYYNAVRSQASRDLEQPNGYKTTLPIYAYSYLTKFHKNSFQQLNCDDEQLKTVVDSLHDAERRICLLISNALNGYINSLDCSKLSAAEFDYLYNTLINDHRIHYKHLLLRNSNITERELRNLVASQDKLEKLELVNCSKINSNSLISFVNGPEYTQKLTIIVWQTSSLTLKDLVDKYAELNAFKHKLLFKLGDGQEINLNCDDYTTMYFACLRAGQTDDADEVRRHALGKSTPIDYCVVLKGYQEEYGCKDVPQWFSLLKSSREQGLRKFFDDVGLEKNVEFEKLATSDKENALHFVAKHGNTNSLSILTSSESAELSESNKSSRRRAVAGRAKLRVSLEGLKDMASSTDAKNKTALHHAAAANNIEYIEYVLNDAILKNKHDVNQRDSEGNTPLHFALQNESVDAALSLINHGADIYAANGSGMSILHVACESGLDDIVTLLIKKYDEQKKLDVEFNREDINGNCALHIAAQQKHHNLRVMRILLDKLNGDEKFEYVAKTNNQKYTALHYAFKRGRPDLACLLLNVDGTLLNLKNASGDTPLNLVERHIPDGAFLFMLNITNNISNITLRNNLPSDFSRDLQKLEKFKSAIDRINASLINVATDEASEDVGISQKDGKQQAKLQCAQRLRIHVKRMKILEDIYAHESKIFALEHKVYALQAAADEYYDYALSKHHEANSQSGKLELSALVNIFKKFQKAIDHYCAAYKLAQTKGLNPTYSKILDAKIAHTILGFLRRANIMSFKHDRRPEVTLTTFIRDIRTKFADEISFDPKKLFSEIEEVIIKLLGDPPVPYQWFVAEAMQRNEAVNAYLVINAEQRTDKIDQYFLNMKMLFKLLYASLMEQPSTAFNDTQNASIKAGHYFEWSFTNFFERGRYQLKGELDDKVKAITTDKNNAIGVGNLEPGTKSLQDNQSSGKNASPLSSSIGSKGPSRGGPGLFKGAKNLLRRRSADFSGKGDSSSTLQPSKSADALNDQRQPSQPKM